MNCGIFFHSIISATWEAAEQGSKMGQDSDFRLLHAITHQQGAPYRGLCPLMGCLLLQSLTLWSLSQCRANIIFYLKYLITNWWSLNRVKNDGREDKGTILI